MLGAGPENASVTATVDAQFTAVQVLKPFANFEAAYQGKPATTPIMFPGVRDQRAGTPGFSPQLAAGIPVPLGARVLLWLPMCFNPMQGGQNYRYRVLWRMQNLNSYRNPGRDDLPRPPYHFPFQRAGSPDSTVLPPAERSVIPAAWRVVAFEQPEAANADGQVHLRVEDVIPRFDDSLINTVTPIYADGSSAVIQQGILDPATNPVGAPLPIFKPFWFDCEGDEIMILVTREDPSSPPNWDFTAAAADLAFSNVYGTGNNTHPSFATSGIYLLTGTNP